MAFVYPKYGEPQPIPQFGDDTATATHAAATVSYAAPGDGLGHVLAGLAVSYEGGTVSGGNVQVANGNVVEFSLDLGAGSLVIPFPMPKLCANNAPVTVTLADGGSAVVGRVCVLGHDIQPSGYSAGMDFSVAQNSYYLPMIF